MGLLGLAWPFPCAAELGVDTVLTAPAFVSRLAQHSPLGSGQGLWLRIRGVPDPAAGSLQEVERTRGALGKLHAGNFRICVLLAPPASTWTGGVRPIRAARLPLDLREAYAWMARLSTTYRGLVDVWEMDNEPDIGFVPENAEAYMAYLKACYLGGHSVGKDPGGAALPLGGVLMAPLAMPPGPYLERLLDNGLLSYTDGINYHYYGYAEDFTGVWRQFAAAVGGWRPGPSAEAGRRSWWSSTNFERPGVAMENRVRRVPVYLTEFGYGMLGGASEADAVAGRVRQWRWFKAVTDQIDRLPIEGAMASCLPPDLEWGWNEFGLTVPAPDASPAPGAPVLSGSGVSGPLVFSPPDFGATRFEPWMTRIGEKIGDGGITPALAYVLAHSSQAQPPETVLAAPPIPVVIDFVGGANLVAVKGDQGYLLAGATSHGRWGDGELWVYNFSSCPVEGQLTCSDAAADREGLPGGGTLRLAAFERRIIPLRLTVPSIPGARKKLSVSFILKRPKAGSAEFSTYLYPGGTSLVLADSAGREKLLGGGENRRRALLQASRAAEEPALLAAGRWLGTEGVTVVEAANGWHIRIERLPATSLRPAVAEFPLADGFAFARQDILSLEMRCLGKGTMPTRYLGLSTTEGGLMQIQFRSANGDLFEVWPRRGLQPAWRTYRESLGSFTLSLFGRAALPWRFAESAPVALVLTFWPRVLPLEVELRSLALTRLPP